MRYLIRLVIPILVFAGVLFLLSRTRRRTRATEDAATPDTGAFIAILAISAMVALGTAYALLDSGD